jgi:hypothetical protein
MACDSKSKTRQSVEILPSKAIHIRSSDISDKDTGILELDSYIILSNKELFGEMRRMIIDEDRIYILDQHLHQNLTKILCFDMKGNLRYKIDNRGAGPREFGNLVDFGLNKVTGQLVAFDNVKMRLFFYDLKTGRYQTDFSIHERLAPTEMGILSDDFFFKNIDNNRFSIQQQQRYFLLYSQDGINVDRMFLPHDAVAEYAFDMPSFFYNDNQRLFFIKPFDNMVYQLLPEEIHSLYQINLPNPLPMRRIEEKMSHFEVIRSSFSHSISNIFQADNILHFTFAKDGFINFVFYDLSINKLLQCSKGFLANPQESLPLRGRSIDGVYNDKFFSYIPMLGIEYFRERHSEFFPSELLKLDENGNGVIIFYTFVGAK